MSFIADMLNKVSITKSSLPDVKPPVYEVSRFKLFRSMLFGKLGTTVFLNIFGLIFAIPLIAVLFLFYTELTLNNIILPYGAGFGIGYPVVTNAAQIGQELMLSLSFRTFLYVMPCIVSLFIGFSGIFYVSRRFLFGEGQEVVKPFFIGLKRYLLPFLFISVFVAGSTTLLLLNIVTFGVLPMNLGLKIFLLILNILLFLFVWSFAIYFTTQAVTFKLSLWTLIKNSFFFTVGLVFYNIIMLIFTAAPFVVVFFTLSIPFVGSLLMMFLIMIGLAYVAFLWTVYAQWIYERYFELAILSSKQPAPVKKEEKSVQPKPAESKDAAMDEKEAGSDAVIRDVPQVKPNSNQQKSKPKITKFKKR